MTPELLTVILFSILVLLLISGLPIAFCLAGTAVILVLWYDPTTLFLIFTTAFHEWNNFLLLAIPLFVLMANFLAQSGIADDLYEMMYQWMGRLRGGLAIGTVVICAIFAAMSGVSAAGTLTMGLIALPSMLKRHYDKSIALGSIAAAGSLGILIPPSIMMVVFASLTGESVGRLFIGGILPGILLAVIFIIYIAVRSYLKPNLGPPVPEEERLPLGRRLALSWGLIAPIVLVFLVLGVIYLGVATPTEAAGIGAFGAFVIAIVRRRFSWTMFREASKGALFITAMTGWIVLGGKLFSHVYAVIGVRGFLLGLIGGVGLNPWVIIITMQVILLIMGCFIDPIGIMMITVPIFVPIVEELGFSLLWFGILFTVNMEIGYITPPFGLNLFYMRSVAPPGVTMEDIYRSIVAFVVLELAGLALLMVFPEIITWLPQTMWAK